MIGTLRAFAADFDGQLYPSLLDGAFANEAIGAPIPLDLAVALSPFPIILIALLLRLAPGHERRRLFALLLFLSWRKFVRRIRQSDAGPLPRWMASARDHGHCPP